MRGAIYVAAVVGVAAAAPGALRSVAVCAASVLFEALPYLALGLALLRIFGRSGGWAATLAGCGCKGGAASIPATLAAWTLFGPGIALGRWVAALAVYRRRMPGAHDQPASLLDELLGLAPAAMLCGLVVTFTPQLDIAHRPALLQAAFGAAAGVVASPCALGGVALAASLRVHAPIAAYALLVTSGIVPFPRPHIHVASDPLAYAALALACAFVAFEGGASLVHPRLALPLGACAAWCFVKAWRARSR